MSSSREYIKLLHLFFALIFICGFSQLAVASQYLTDNSLVKLIAGDNRDILVTPKPNSQGISYATFTSFTVDRALAIMNEEKDGDSNSASKLIIIQADSINLLGRIDLVGVTADILFISTNVNYNFNCTNCSMSNFGRVTFAQAMPLYDANYYPGVLNLLSSGSMVINGLSTSHVASVEFISKNISVDGQVNTQEKGSYTSDGNFQLNPTGSLIVGAGGINIFSGFNIDYKQLTLKQPINGATLLMPSTLSVTSQAVHIATAAPIVFSGNIKTTSDAVTAANYQGHISAIEESIKIYSLFDGADVTINGSLVSDNLVDIQGATNLNVNGTINTKSLNLVAGSKLNQRGTSDFFTASVAADVLENNGRFTGRTIQIATKHDLQNRFGGKIFADDIKLSSQFSVVRNGSQYPFKPASDVPLVLSQSALDSNHLGTINGIPFNGATKVNDLSALILGKTITIVAAGNVENINPYFEFTLDPTVWANGVPFKQDKAEQVQIVADDTLSIGSFTYVLNSSAILGVNNPGGDFIVSAPYVTNERYNTQVVIQPFSSTTTSGGATTTTTGIESALVVFSPPGVIYSFSPLGFYFTVKNGGFVNNTAYFEVLNNATFTSSKTATEIETSKVTSIGIALQQKLNGSTTVKTLSISECLQKLSAYEGASRACYNNLQVTNYSNLAGTTNESMQGTLFSVKGTISGAASEFYGTNHLAIDDANKEQINNFIAANSGQNGTFQNKMISSNGSTLTTTYSYTQSATLSADGKSLYIIQNGTQIAHSGTGTGEAEGRFLGAQTTSRTVASYNLADWLAAKFAELKVALMSMLQAFQNWLNG